MEVALPGQSFALSTQDFSCAVSKQPGAGDKRINPALMEDNRTTATDAMSRNLLSPGDSLPFLELLPLLCPGRSSTFL